MNDNAHIWAKDECQKELDKILSNGTYLDFRFILFFFSNFYRLKNSLSLIQDMFKLDLSDKNPKV